MMEEVKSKAILADAAGNTSHDGSGVHEEPTGRNPDTLPSSRDKSGTCPRCGRTSNFSDGGSLPLKFMRTQSGRRVQQQIAVLDCQGCGDGTAVVEELQKTPGLAGLTMTPIHWYPITGAVIDMSDVPPNLVSAFQEGVRCVSVEAPHAAVAMFRNALAQIVQNKGSEEAKKKETLNLAVKQMVADRTLHDGFQEWADHVRKVGNAGAHQESWDEIPLEQAQELQDLVQHLIDTLYVQPAKLRRAMPAKKRPKP